jgi:periplasmic protein TonB
MKMLIMVLSLISLTCVSQNDKKGTIKVKKVISDSVYVSVDQMPDFPGGNSKLYNFISSFLIYPVSAIEKGSSGTVYISFIIKKDGEITDIRVLNGISGCAECDMEAIRVIKMMPKWNPGLNRGIPVSVRFNLPIKFKLK